MYSTNIPPPPPPSYIEATAGTGFGNQYNTQYSTPLPKQDNFQVPAPQQQPLGQPVFNQGYAGPMQPMVTPGHNPQMISGLPRPRYLQLQRLAIMAMVCCLPLGIFVWFEFKKAAAAFNRGANTDGERHVANVKRFSYCALFFGLLVFVIIIINPARIIQWASGDHEPEEYDKDEHD